MGLCVGLEGESTRLDPDNGALCFIDYMGCMKINDYLNFVCELI